MYTLQTAVIMCPTQTNPQLHMYSLDPVNYITLYTSTLGVYLITASYLTLIRCNITFAFCLSHKYTMATQKTPPERVLITNHFINKHGKSNVCTHMYISIQTGYI